MDHRSWKEPTRLFESMVVIGLHPNCDIQALQRQYIVRKSEGSVDDYLHCLDRGRAASARLSEFLRKNIEPKPTSEASKAG